MRKGRKFAAGVAVAAVIGGAAHAILTDERQPGWFLVVFGVLALAAIYECRGSGDRRWSRRG
jgi:hypothetical protein